MSSILAGKVMFYAPIRPPLRQPPPDLGVKRASNDQLAPSPGVSADLLAKSLLRRRMSLLKYKYIVVESGGALPGEL